jgi:hypothetical protein
LQGLLIGFLLLLDPPQTPKSIVFVDGVDFKGRFKMLDTTILEADKYIIVMARLPRSLACEDAC